MSLLPHSVRRLLSIPLAESALGAIAAGALARYGTGKVLRAKGDRDLVDDPNYYANVKRASWMLGALAGAANPFLRDADTSSSQAFWQSMTTPHIAGEMYDPSPFFGTVDKTVAQQVLSSDLFLTQPERRGILGLVGTAPEVAPDRTSSFGLTQSALRAGVAFVPAYAFGQLAGKALGVDDTVAKNISRVGALAFAMRASGITEYL